MGQQPDKYLALGGKPDLELFPSLCVLSPGVL